MDFLKKLIPRLRAKPSPVQESEFFSDPVPKGMMSNRYIPDIPFDSDYILYNIGYNKDKDSFLAILKPLSKRASQT